jgi:hypothetical protein
MCAPAAIQRETTQGLPYVYPLFLGAFPITRIKSIAIDFTSENANITIVTLYKANLIHTIVVGNFCSVHKG